VVTFEDVTAKQNSGSRTVNFVRYYGLHGITETFKNGGLISNSALSMCRFIFRTKFKVRHCVMSEGALCEPLSCLKHQ
jgi:hypothetical protein